MDRSVIINLKYLYVQSKNANNECLSESNISYPNKSDKNFHKNGAKKMNVSNLELSGSLSFKTIINVKELNRDINN